MIKDFLKEDAYKSLLNAIQKSGKTKNEIAKACRLNKQDINKIYDGDFDNIDFLMIADVCHEINYSVFSLIKEDTKLYEFINAIN